MARKILVVDDDPNILRLISFIFQAEGYNVTMGSSGAEALAQVTSQQPDLMVLDVMLPDMSGMEICQRVRSNPATAHLPILMLSARSTVGDKVSGLKSGADDYLPKPADRSELVARAEALLARAGYATPPVGRILTFMGVKGGVGTTTVALNVGAQIASQGKSAWLIELGTAPGASAPLLRLQPSQDLQTLTGRPPAELTQSDIQKRLVSHSCGLRILPTPQVVEAPYEIGPDLVQKLLDLAAHAASYVLLDLPPSWSAANSVAMQKAWHTCLVCEPDSLNMHCARAMLGTLRRWGITGDLVGLVVVSRGNNPIPLTLPTIRGELQANVDSVIPPAGDACSAAAKEGVPLAILQPRHLAATALKDLAGRLTADRVRPLP